MILSVLSDLIGRCLTDLLGTCEGEHSLADKMMRFHYSP